MRKNCDSVIYVDFYKAVADGIEFFRSVNDVILTEGKNGILPKQYFKEIRDIKTNELLFPKDDLRESGGHSIQCAGKFAYADCL